MLAIYKILGAVALLILLFLASGFVANLVLVHTSCIWTSSGVFGVTFISFGLAGLQLISGVLDALHLF